MIQVWRVALLCVCVGMASLAYAGEGAPAPVVTPPPVVAPQTTTPAVVTTASSLVSDFYAHLVDTMKRGDTLGFKGRYDVLAPAIKRAFNMPLMTRFAVGSAWMNATDEQKASLVEAFTNFSVATYASRFTHYTGEKFEVVGEKPAAGGGTMVETHLTPAGSDPVTLNYLVRSDESGVMRIVDVFLDATISELATRRSEFSAIVRRDGLGSLVHALDEKAKKMEAT